MTGFMTRRAWLFGALTGAACAMTATTSFPAADETVTITDVTGRQVRLSRPARKIILAEGRQIVALSLIHSDPVSLLAGWLGDFKRNDSQSYALFKHKFPGIDDVPILGLGSDGTFSIEQAIASRPEVAILGVSFATGGHANDVAGQLEAAGIPVVFTDFVVNPFQNTVPSIKILGQVIGADDKAQDFSAYYESRMARIAEGLSRNPGRRPTILVEAHAGMADCCFAPGKGNIGRFIEFVGADSISAAIIPGQTGHLGIEYVIAKDPEIYVATGGAHLAATGGLVIGPGYSADTIRQRLAALSSRAGISQINAVRNGRVHGLFHNLLSTPLNILAVENLAKWTHPEMFADLDPARTMADLNERFLAVPMEGIYWIDLKPR